MINSALYVKHFYVQMVNVDNCSPEVLWNSICLVYPGAASGELAGMLFIFCTGFFDSFSNTFRILT
jgi:hypothetical protein